MEKSASASLFFSCVIFAILVFVHSCDDANCNASNGTVCNEQGKCNCGMCICDKPYSGPTCEECPTCLSPCEIYKGCVGCKIFGTGPLSAMECIIHCDYIATYLPVDKSDFDVDESNDKILCRTLNKDYCMESFRIGEMRDGYRDLYVRTDMDCDAKYIPTEPTVIEVSLYSDDEENVDSSESDPAYKGGNKAEEVEAVAGSNQGQTRDGGNGCVRIISSYIPALFASLVTAVVLYV